jgi:putative ABC transport system substrate-binding protein
VWPLAATAQQPKAAPVVGYLDGRSANSVPPYVSAWRAGLRETGYVEGQSVTIEARWAEGRYDRLPELAVDLVHRRVDAMLVTGNAAALAAKAASATIPIVYVAGFDPVQSGMVASLNRPGANVTGVSLLISEVLTKRLELLHELVPGASIIGWLVNPTNPGTKSEFQQIEIAARTLHLNLHVLKAGGPAAIDDAFASAARQNVGAVVVDADVLFDARLDQIIALAARYRFPAVYGYREYVTAGGLLSYGEDRAASYRQAGIYLGRILRGEKPEDLPVQQPTKFDLVINLKTAKALGLTIAQSILLRADEVIE